MKTSSKIIKISSSTPSKEGLLKWVNKHILTNKIQNSDELINCWCIHVDKLITNTGCRNTIQRVKTYRLHYTRFLCGHPLYINSNNVSVNKNGLPRALGFLGKLLTTKEPDQIRFIMTLLLISRSIEGGHGAPDLKPITEPSPALDWDSYRSEIREALISLKIRLDQPQPIWKDYHPSTKKGPNGQALMSSVNDAYALKKYPELLQDIITLGGNPQLLSVIKLHQVIPLDDWCSKVGLKPTQDIRKLSSVLDPEAKTRIIAIFDYWSQTVLKPLHDYIMKQLRNLPCDRTYQQTKGFPGKPLDNYWSLDLTNATDRFPLGFQKVVISEIFGDQYSEAWARVMVSQPFSNPWGEPAIYAAGQPMGAYSSWAVFTISHHVLIHIAGRRCGIPSVDPYYQILGDDIVISHDALAKEYQRLIKELGVSISQPKTHISTDMFEFAKRWYLRGNEVSGIPIKGFLTASTAWWQLLPEMDEALNRVGRTNELVAPRVFSSLLRMQGMPSRYARRLYETSVLLTSEEERRVRWAIFRQRNSVFLTGSCNWSEERFNSFLRQSIATLWAASLEEDLKALRDTQKKLQEIMKDLPGPGGTSLSSHPERWRNSIAPIAVVTPLYKEAKDKIQGLKERDYTDEEVIRMARAPLILDPTSLLHERRKDIKARSQVNLTKKIKLFMLEQDDIRRRLTMADPKEFPYLFNLQQSRLPSWARDKVSWSHLWSQYKNHDYL